MDNKKIIYLKVKNSSPEEILGTYSFEQMDEAYQMASEFEENGVEVELMIPGAAESLANELGLSLEERDKLFSSIEQEMDDHDD
ncbi:MAG: hypothetical protein QE271_14300 [Bacteriovoracaceae bacterium]|nr:hypothetical protein [Bacteriovoracaceae bacterium]